MEAILTKLGLGFLVRSINWLASKSIDKIALSYESNNFLRNKIYKKSRHLHRFLLNRARKTRGQKAVDGTEFLALISKFEAVDRSVLLRVRAEATTLTRDELLETYNLIFESKAGHEGLDPNELIALLNTVGPSEFLREERIAPKLRMVLETVNGGEHPKIGQITFQNYSEDVLFVIPNADLLWPCTCGVQRFRDLKEPRETTPTECPLHRLGDVKDVENAFGNEIVEIQYDGMEIIWKNDDHLWPPSLDSLCFIESMRAEGLDQKTFNSVIDIGSGTGALGIWLAMKNESVTRIDFSDWLMKPLAFSAFNAAQNLDDNRIPDRSFYLGYGIDLVGETEPLDKYDIALCHPPYLPVFSGHKSSDFPQTVYGTELLEDFIKRGLGLAYQAYISFSDIAWPEAKKAADSVNVKLVPVGPKRTMPFRVGAFYDRPEYINWLIDDGRLSYRPKETFPLWHSIRLYKIVKN